MEGRKGKKDGVLTFSFLLTAPEFLGLFAHIFIVPTIILAFVCVKPVRPRGRSSKERRRSLISTEKPPLSFCLVPGWVFFFSFDHPIIKIHLRERRFCSGRVWLNGKRSRSLSSSRRAHLERAELCPRGEDEGMMSCVRPSLPFQPAAPAQLSPSRHRSPRAALAPLSSCRSKQTKNEKVKEQEGYRKKKTTQKL